MPQKSKKTKKNDVAKHKQTSEADKAEKSKSIPKGLNLKGAENLTLHFSRDELQEIKEIIQSKDLFNLPLVLAAVIVNKVQIVKDLVQKGSNVNETGPNNVTALMWAIKCKNLDIIDLLLANGADPTIKNDSGNNILFMALENKLWDEEEYINLWNRVKNISFVDVDFMGKNGRNMVHATVRREWKNVLDILIAEKANVNTENANGRTPLMVASYLNNFGIVNALLQAHADHMKEDANGCMALCYAISHVINKEAPSPHLVVDKLLECLRVHKVSLIDFFKSRIDTIFHTTVKQDKTGHPVLDTKVFIIHYVLRYAANGLRIMLEVDILKRMAEEARKYIHEPLQIAKFLAITNEVMRYCECYFGAAGLEKKIIEDFVINGLADTCHSILKMYGLKNGYNYDFITRAFGPILTVCVSHPEGKSWLTNNIVEALPFYKIYIKRNPIVKNSDEILTITRNEKILNFRRLVETIKEEKELSDNAQLEVTELKDVHHDCQKLKEALNSVSFVKENKQEPKSNPKKSKRRARALKAKITKIKNADLAERLNQNGRQLLEQKCISDTSIAKVVAESEEPEIVDEIAKRAYKPWNKHSAWEQIWLVDNSNDILVHEFNECVSVLENHFITDIKDDLFNINFELVKRESKNEPKPKQCEKKENETYEIVPLYPDWQNDDLPPIYVCTHKIKKEKKITVHLPKSGGCTNVKVKPSEQEIKDLLSYTVDYLSGLLKKIIITYQKHWEQDKVREKILMNDHGDVSHQHEKPSSTSLAIEKLEIEHIQHVQKQFDKLVGHIKNYANKNFTICSKIIDKLESILLNHKIRGKSIIQDTAMQVFNFSDDSDEDLSDFYETDQDMPIPKYVENLLNRTRSQSIIDDSTFNTACLGNQKFETNSHKHSDALYLQEILALPPKPHPNLDKHKRNKIKTMKNAYHLVPSIISMCEDNEELTSTKREDVTKQEASTYKYRKRQTLQETLQAMPKIDDTNKLLEVLETNHCNSDCQSLMENTTSRWCNTIRSLQMMNCYQILLNGEIRVSNKDETHTISNGGNFSPVILGLDASDRPLAVKRIKKDSSVCKTMKTLLNPLLGLRNTNLLHYFSCNYEENELVLATPLCEYNMGEYIMIMKQSPNIYITSIDIVKQFLAGLRFLHDRMEPIVHGNLKPSNIFIDLNGIVRIAEFGMHKALYTLTEAPNTSIIWFSRETFAAFKELASIRCTCASDIQVAGMLIHFMLTAGKHPYGEIMQDILKNLERAVPQLVTTDVDLHDLISWMLLYEPNERPTINQVLSHVYFWSIERKWRFILTCSGVSSHGTPLNIPLNELHLYINVVAARENIKGRWINITKTRFPNMSYSKDDEDSITGLLRFIRKCMRNQVALHINLDLEFRNFILSSFPALPLSLYRILECSQWLNHRALQPFTTVDSLSA